MSGARQVSGKSRQTCASVASSCSARSVIEPGLAALDPSTPPVRAHERLDLCVVAAWLRRRRNSFWRYDQLPAAAALQPDRDADCQRVEFETRALGRRTSLQAGLQELYPPEIRRQTPFKLTPAWQRSSLSSADRVHLGNVGWYYSQEASDTQHQRDRP
jgi:hypothetical protein